MIEDTIAAIPTPPGTGGIGIIRLSGKDVFYCKSNLKGKKIKIYQH